MVVDAIVVAFHGDPWLEACVAFVREAREPGIRLIIGDNFGNSSVPSLVDGRRIASVVLPGPLGFAEANNESLVRVGFDAEFICFLNQDTKSPEGWLTKAAEFMRRHPGVGAMTPLISTYEGDGWDPNFVAVAKNVPGFTLELASGNFGAEFHDVPAVPAPAMVVRTEVLKQVGGFDPIFGSYYEDSDLCHRIRSAGYRVGIWTGATVAHFSGSATRTAEDERRRQRLIVRNRLIYRVRTSEDGRWRQLGRELFVELPRQLGRRLLGRPASKALSVLFGGHWDAVRLVRRLVSSNYDQYVWCRYLDSIGWPPCASRFRRR